MKKKKDHPYDPTVGDPHGHLGFHADIPTKPLAARKMRIVKPRSFIKVPRDLPLSCTWDIPTGSRAPFDQSRVVARLGGVRKSRAGSLRSLTAIRQDTGLFCESFLRTGEAFANVGRNQNLKNLKDKMKMTGREQFWQFLICTTKMNEPNCESRCVE